VKIRFSRHAKRRAKLYHIPDSTVIHILANLNLKQGEHEIIKAVPGSKHPLKIIVTVEGETLTVVTNYPMKRGRKK
jgi:hypothetical protein